MGGRRTKKPSRKTTKRQPAHAAPPFQESTMQAAAFDKGEEKPYRFVILKNYPESRQFEIVKKNKGFFASLLERLGLKKGTDW